MLPSLSSRSAWSFSVVIALLVNGCALLSGGSGQGRPEVTATQQDVLDEADAAVSAGRLGDAAQMLCDLAPTLPTAKINETRLRGAEFAWQDGQVELAERCLGAMTLPLDNAAQTARYRVLQARLALQAGRPVAVLPEPAVDYPLALQADVFSVRAAVLANRGDVLNSLRARLQQARATTEVAAKDKVYAQFWRVLAEVDFDRIEAWRAEQAADDPLLPWLALVVVRWTAGPEPKDLADALAGWQTLFPTVTIPPSIEADFRLRWQRYGQYPQNVAVLLSLTGEYASVTRSVLHGFLAGYYAMPVNDRPRLHFFDVGSAGLKPGDAYRRAVQAGAELVVGPFRKALVQALVESIALNTPVLALNYLPETVTPPSTLYQFGLLPEDEATQVADRVSLAGYRHAISMVVEGEWGERLGRAFAERFAMRGGEVVKTVALSRDHSTYGELIRTVLQVREIDLPSPASTETGVTAETELAEDDGQVDNADETPAQEPADEPGETRIQSVFVHRDDVDVIFLGAPPAIARGVQPQLRFQYADDIPVYATSHVFSGEIAPAQDQDLDGIVFCDIPWVLHADNAWRDTLEQALPKNRQTNFPRFLALGIDAYQLLPYLDYLGDRPHKQIEGQTGLLGMDGQRRIHRQVQWARFTRGAPRLLQSLLTEPGPGQ